MSTIRGRVRVARSHWHCEHCRTGQLPWDAQQGLDTWLRTPRVKALVCQVSARLPYAGTVALLAETTAVRLEESSAEVIVRDVGAQVRAAREEEMSAYVSGRDVALVRDAPERLYLAAAHTAVKQPDEVVVLGRQGDEEISADAMAEALSSIHYEVLTAISNRVPRVYIQNGQIVAIRTLSGLVTETGPATA